MNYLNLGCGNRFHSDWTNIDFYSNNDQVIACDLSQGIPLNDQFFDVVYHSHVLEHFSRKQAPVFIQECYRVLKKGGILRVVVPDLEEIAKLYLKALDQIRNGSQEWSNHYEWILLEMYDQTVRNYSGGEMLEYCSQKELPNTQFMINRCGIEIKQLIEKAQKTEQQNQKIDLRSIFLKLTNLKKYSHYFKEVILKILLLNEYESLRIGRFRQQGEIHQWMYDEYSLGKLLTNSGFEKIIRRTATESYIAHWTHYNLDTEPDGSIYKPDSLFMEAIKPL